MRSGVKGSAVTKVTKWDPCVVINLLSVSHRRIMLYSHTRTDSDSVQHDTTLQREEKLQYISVDAENPRCLKCNKTLTNRGPEILSLILSLICHNIWLTSSLPRLWWKALNVHRQAEVCQRTFNTPVLIGGAAASLLVSAISYFEAASPTTNSAITP